MPKTEDGTGSSGSEERHGNVVNPANVKISTYAPLPQQFESTDDWLVYTERIEQYFEAYDITDLNRRVAILLASLSYEVFGTLSNLCFPDKLKTKTYEEIDKLMADLFISPVSVYGERMKFYEAKQKNGESITDFMSRLKKLTRYCKFGVYYQSVLRDKFVCGLMKGPILSKVSELDENASFKDCVETALKKELAVREKGRDNEVFKIRRQSSPKKDYNQINSSSRNSSTSHNLRNSSQSAKVANCNACGEYNHDFNSCKYKKYKCKVCKKVGHLAKVCRKNDKSNNFTQMESEEECESESDIEVNLVGLYNVSGSSNEDDSLNSSNSESDLDSEDEKVVMNVCIDKKNFDFEIDTGSGKSLCSKEFYDRNLKKYNLKPCNTRFKFYDGTRVNSIGRVTVKVVVRSCVYKLKLVVMEKGGNPLIGRDFLRLVNPNYKSELINRLNRVDRVQCDDSDIQKLINDNSVLFRDELGCYKYSKVRFELEGNSKPVFCKARRVPLAFQEEYQRQIASKVDSGMLKKIEYSEWGTPLVVSPKRNGGLRICGDYSVTVNEYVKPVSYSLPLIEDLFAILNGGEHFTKMDLSEAYHQLELDEESQKMLTWSTTEGLFALTRMPFGISPASAIFQSIINKTLQGCKGTCACMDDILVTGRTREEHIENLDAVFKKLSDAGFTLRKDKCEFFKEKVKYLGYIVDKHGLHKDPEKVEAILNAPRPKSVTEVKSFVGLVGFYARFFPNIAQVLAPIYKLVQKDQPFDWNVECDEAFQVVKQTIVSDKVLVHYEQKLPVILQCDASMHGVGAALFHKMDDGTERPIAFASRTLTKAERNYSALDREALAIHFGFKKFTHYILGRKFTLLSDHEPLIAILGPKKGIPAMAAGRLQRWALFLSNFTFDVKHIKGKHNVNADFLSRCSINSSISDDNEIDEVLYLNFMASVNQSLIDRTAIKKAISTDKVISQVIRWVRFGWPENSKKVKEFHPFFIKKEQLTVEDNILMWGYRVIIPTMLRKDLLENLHASHEGIVKMKARARSYFWWPNLNSDIEELSRSCRPCVVNAPNPPKVPPSPWPASSYPGERIHADFFGPLRKRMYLVILDSYTKWPEVYQMSSMNAQQTVIKFRDYFARFGIADLIVSDNGGQFVANEFDHFCQRNGVKTITTAAFKPQSNGAAENAVKSFKSGVDKAVDDPKNANIPLDMIISRYLFFYRSSVHTTTGETPHMLMFGREMKTHFDRLKPKIMQTVIDRVAQRINKDQLVDKKRTKIFNEGDMVMVKVFRGNDSLWKQAAIIAPLGVNMFTCKLENGRIVRKHKDQIQNRVVQAMVHGKSKNQIGQSHDLSPKVTRSGRKY